MRWNRAMPANLSGSALQAWEAQKRAAVDAPRDAAKLAKAAKATRRAKLRAARTTHTDTAHDSVEAYLNDGLPSDGTSS